MKFVERFVFSKLIVIAPYKESTDFTKVVNQRIFTTRLWFPRLRNFLKNICTFLQALF